MNKSELIAAMAADSGLSKADTEKALNAFLGQVEKALKAGDKVQLTGFGSFEVKERAERILRQQRREKRLKKWGYSTKEFDQIMEEHLRSKSQIKKPGLRDRWKK